VRLLVYDLAAAVRSALIADSACLVADDACHLDAGAAAVDDVHAGLHYAVVPGADLVEAGRLVVVVLEDNIADMAGRHHME
jgi:hypothetical protein